MKPKDETKPKTITMVTCIKARKDGLILPIGWTDAFTSCPDGWLVCDGRYLLRTDHPELFAQIGNHYCPPTIAETLPMPAWKVALMFFGFRFQPVTRFVANPDYVEGYFRLPDMRSRFVKSAETLGFIKPQTIRGLAELVAKRGGA